MHIRIDTTHTTRRGSGKLAAAAAGDARQPRAGVPSSAWIKNSIRGLMAAWALAVFEPREAVALSPVDEIPNFSLLDYRGRHHELHRLEGRVAVLFFTGNGCPIARESVEKLQQVEKAFGRDLVRVWAINSYSQDDRAEIAKEAREFRFNKIPILLDQKQSVALTLGVQRTAEVIAVSTKDWKPFYRGAIDDQLSEGAKKPRADAKYLETAIREFLAGKEPSLARTSAKGCLIAYEKVSAAGDGSVSYSKQVAPIIESKCVGCHSEGNIGPFAFSSHGKVKNKARMIEEVIATQRMPPWHADPHYGKWEKDRSLTARETQTILRWIAQGAPQDGSEDPLARTLPPVPDWPLGKPDYVLRLPHAEKIPATGVLEYRHIRVDNVVPRDCWLRAIDVRPGNRKVVHHVILRAKYPSGADDGSGRGVRIAGWAPGGAGAFYPEGVGRFFPKDAELDMEMHYTTMGSEQTDQTEIGLHVMLEKPAVETRTVAALNLEFSIPPGEADFRTFATYGFQKDSLIYSFSPHMHLRGSWFKFEALHPDGKRETLLSVPHYDFNWQTPYRLKEPMRVRQGTWILCTGGFDNSAKNPFNSEPGKRVTWGDQSFDEMFIGFMDVAEAPAEPLRLSSH